METTLLNKQAGELTADELQALLAEKQAKEKAERIQKRRAYEALRDETVTSLIEHAKEVRHALKALKNKTWSEVETLYALLQEHSDRHANGKGTVTLDTGDGAYRLVFKRHDNTRFDERATQAEAHIIDFLVSNYSADDPTSKLIRKLFERKKGALDKDQVLKIISMKDDFDNENWRKGIELLQESIVPGETKYYAQFFEMNGDGEWLPISLDFARL